MGKQFARVARKRQERVAMRDTAGSCGSRTADADTQAKEDDSDPAARASPTGAMQRSTQATDSRDTGSDSAYVDFEHGPDPRTYESRYGISVGGSEVTRLQRLESEFGSDQVARWADEGMGVETMGKPRDMAAYRKRDETSTLQRGSGESDSDRSGGNGSSTNGGGAVDAVDAAVSSPGIPLEEPVQRDMGAKLNADFSDVRIHTGSEAATAADSIGARAFTVGNDVVFNRSEYDPGSNEGTEVLAHELTHVRQQSNGEVRTLPGDGGGLVVDPDPALEREAEQTAQRVTAGETAEHEPTRGRSGIYRLEDEEDEADSESESDNGSDNESERDSDEDWPTEEEVKEFEIDVDEDEDDRPPGESELDPFLDVASDDDSWPPGTAHADEYEADMDLEDAAEAVFEAYMETDEGQEIQERVDELQEEAEKTAKEAWESNRVKATVIAGVVGGLFAMYATETEIPDAVIDEAKEHIDLSYEAGSLTIEFDPEYSGVPFDPDEWGGDLDFTYELDDEHSVSAGFDYRDREYEEVVGGEVQEVEEEILDIALGFSGEAGSISLDAKFEDVREAASLADLDVEGTMDIEGDDWDLDLVLGYVKSQDTVDEDEFEELFGEPPDPISEEFGSGQAVQGSDEEFEELIVEHMTSASLDYSLERDDAMDLDLGIGLGYGQIGVEDQLEARLEAAIETTNEFKAGTELLLEVGPAGTAATASLQTQYELLDDLESTLNYTYERTADVEIDWRLTHQLQYQVDQVQLQLDKTIADDDVSIMFGIGLEY